MEHTKYNWVISLSRQLHKCGDEPISGILLVDMKYSIIEETFERIMVIPTVYIIICVMVMEI